MLNIESNSLNTESNLLNRGLESLNSGAQRVLFKGHSLLSVVQRVMWWLFNFFMYLRYHSIESNA